MGFGSNRIILVSLQDCGKLDKLPCLPCVDEWVPSHLQLLKNIMDKDGRHVLAVLFVLIVVEHVFLPTHLAPCRVIGKEIYIPLLPLVQPWQGELNYTFGGYELIF